MPHYCRICGQTRSNGRFYGNTYACIDCSKLTISEQHEKELLTRIDDLVLPLKPVQKKWLESMEADPRERVRKAAREKLR